MRFILQTISVGALLGTICITAILLYASPLHAQFPDITPGEIPGIGNPIILRTTPASPKPGETVTVQAISYTLDFNRASLVWRVDGRVVAEGSGITNITLEAGQIGSATTVSFSATEGGETYTKELVVRPSTVDILWQAGTYTPVLYKGRALLSVEAPLRLVAVPEIVVGGQRLTPAELVFTWKLGSQTLGNQSGLGRNTIDVVGPRPSGLNTFSVTVTTQDSSAHVTNSIKLRPIQPQLLFYEYDPVLGMRYENALTETYELRNEEVTLTAHPFFFTGTTRTATNNTFEWRVNNKETENPLEDQSSITLRQTGSSGSANISLIVQNMEEILQRAVGRLHVTFEGTNRVSF